MHASLRGKWTAVICKGMQDMYLLMNVYQPLTQGHICDVHGNIKETDTVAEYIQHMNNVVGGDRIINSY
jgi:hypothetical protein